MEGPSCSTNSFNSKDVKTVLEGALAVANRSTTTSASGNPSDDVVLLQPFDYIRAVPGKNVRSKLAVAFNHWLKVSPETLNKVCDIVEMLHNSSLL